jgi:anhydro-N-acetylmuramic acid kinase
MTGTSCDGLDCSCIAIDGNTWKTLWTASLSYPSQLRQRVLEAQRYGRTPAKLEALALNRDLGEWYGKSLERLIARKPVRVRPHAIANHGQTVVHLPGSGVTLQLGDPARVAARTGLTTISHFRHGDIAVGGEGAPLVPLFHKLLAGRMSDAKRGIAIHNLGGISNLTYLAPRGQVLAFDTGPGNIWIDAAAARASRGRARMDRDGKLAASGEIDLRAVVAVLKHPYFSKPIPKSTGRDDFPI